MAAASFFQRMCNASFPAVLRLFISQSDGEQRQKSEIVVEGKAGEQTIGMSKLLAKPTVHSLVRFVFPELHFRFTGTDITKHTAIFLLSFGGSDQNFVDSATLLYKDIIIILHQTGL